MFASTHSTSARPQVFRPGVEALDERRLMSIVIDNGRLEITGSENRDEAYVYLTNNTATVVAVRSEYDAQGMLVAYEEVPVSRYLITGGIVFHGRGGDDTFTNY